MLVASDRRYHFDVDPAGFWAVIAATGQYRAWWPWLRTFDAPSLRAGEEWACVVQPPLPYRVAFVLTLDSVEPHRLVSATARGDITGTARLEVAPNGSGSAVRLVSELRPNNLVLRGASYLMQPLVRFGHDWVLDNGARQFAARALSTPPRPLP